MSDEERFVNPDELPEEPAPEVPIEVPPEEEALEAIEPAEDSAPEDSAPEDGVTEEPTEFSLPAGPIEPSTKSEDVIESTDDDRLMAALAWFSMVILQLPIISVILLRCNILGKSIAYVGILANICLLTGDIGTAFSYARIFAILIGIGYLMVTIWCSLVSWNLFQLAKNKRNNGA